MSESSLLLRNVRPLGAEATDVLIRAGRIDRLGPSLESGDAEVIDGRGDLLLPGLVEAHTHLDKTLLGMAWFRNEVGPRLIDRIENERRMKRVLGIDPARQSARQVVQSVGFGTTHIRSHVDVDTEIGVAGIEGVLATREQLKELVDIELVAFPQSGLLIRPGTLEVMARALELGAEVVGGLDPSGIDRDPKGHLGAIFGLADRFGRSIDVHLHEPGELGAFAMELIVERTRAHAMQGRVTVSHAFCLGMPDPMRVAGLVDALAEAEVHIMTTGPASHQAPVVKQLRNAGVVVCSGSDGIRDTWGPYGNGDMLARAMFLGQRNNFRRDDELELALDVCTFGGAQVMALEGYGLEPGCRADLVLVPGECIAAAIVEHRPRRLVLKRGRVVARDGKVLTEVP